MKEIEDSAAMNTLEETINAETENDKYQCSILVEKIERALDQSIKLNSLPSRRCIYRVPYPLRKLNEEDYTPQVVSVGPFHYCSLKLQSMENFKLRCLQSFMKRGHIKLKDLVSSIKDMEQSVRECYAEEIEINSDDFIKLILMDACFVIEFFFINGLVEVPLDHGNLKKGLNSWQISRISLDLILLENQLLLFIIQKLYELLLPLENHSPSKYPSTFLELAFYCLAFLNPQEKRTVDPDLNQIMHVLDLLRYFNLPPRQRLPERSYEGVEEMYSAIELAEAGLKFQVSSSKCPLELKYNKGVLEIPSFNLDTFTLIYARNVMAFEQCHYPNEEYVTDYFKMLDFLVTTGKDVDILVDQKIIEKMPTTNIRKTLYGNLCTGILYWVPSKDYYDLATQLVDFRRKHWYGILKTTLRQDYFRTPWMGAATIGAIILLILTLIQTICTIISILKILLNKH